MKSVGVDNFIFEQKYEEVNLMLEILRDLIHYHIPKVQETIKWKLPFFMYHGNFAYLNVQKQKVVLAFYNGKYMNDEYGILNNDTSLIKKIAFENVDLIEALEQELSEYLLQAKNINKKLNRK